MSTTSWPLWIDLSNLWSQVTIPNTFKSLSRIWARCSRTVHSVPLRQLLTADTGTNGKASVNICGGPRGSRAKSAEELANWASLRSMRGDLVSISVNKATPTVPSEANCPASDGCTADTSVLTSVSSLNSLSYSKDPVGKRHPLTIRLLQTIHAAIDFTQAQQRLLWGSLLIGFFFLLWRSEYLKIGSKRHGVTKLGTLTSMEIPQASGTQPPLQSHYPARRMTMISAQLPVSVISDKPPNSSDN